MKYLIVGLGNIGSEYSRTRHNVGFMVLDHLATSIDAPFSTDRLGDVAKGRLKNKQLVLLKPNTYMNLSGKAVRYWMEKENIPIDRILVVTDDIAIGEGMLRLKGKGSDGGHNGLKNINLILNSQQYARLRFGVGSDFGKGNQVNYVLGEWTNEQLKVLTPNIQFASECCKAFVLSGLQFAMNGFNKKSPPKPPAA